MTKLMLDDQLYQSASQVAAVHGQTVDEYIGETVKKAVASATVRQTLRNGLPVMVVSRSVPVIDAVTVRRCIEEEGF